MDQPGMNMDQPDPSMTPWQRQMQMQTKSKQLQNPPQQPVGQQESQTQPKYLVNPNDIYNQHQIILKYLQMIYDYGNKGIITEVMNLINNAVCNTSDHTQNWACEDAEIVKRSWRSDSIMLANTIPEPTNTNPEIKKFLIMYANFVVLIKMMKGRMLQQGYCFPGYFLPPNITVQPSLIRQQPIPQQSMAPSQQMFRQQQSPPQQTQQKPSLFINVVFSNIIHEMSMNQQFPVLQTIDSDNNMLKIDLRHLAFSTLTQTAILVYNTDVVNLNEYNFAYEIVIYNTFITRKLNADIFIATPSGIYSFSIGYRLALKDKTFGKPEPARIKKFVLAYRFPQINTIAPM